MEPDEIDKESLRLEYKIAFERQNHYGKLVWQIASIFLPVSIGGFAFGIQQNLPLDRFILLNFALSILLLFYLFQVSRMRWLSNIQEKRCKEIEEVSLPMKLVT